MGDLRRGKKTKTARIFIRRTYVRQRGTDDCPAKVKKQTAATGYDQQIYRVTLDLVHDISFPCSVSE
jgi:hypothetical protein